MDLYLPDEFYALSESPNPHDSGSVHHDDDATWLGGEAFVSPPAELKSVRRKRIGEPDPIWCVV